MKFTPHLSSEQLPIAVQARQLGKSRSSMYYQPKQPAKDAAMLERIQGVRAAHPTFGRRRIADELGVNVKRVERLMVLHGLRAKASHPRGTRRAPSLAPRFPNLVHGLAIDRPDHVWGGVIAPVRWGRRRASLAVVMDLDTRQILGWKLALGASPEHALDALTMALSSSGRTPAIFHSGPRAEFLNDDFVEMLESRGIVPSNARTNRRFENAVLESSVDRFLFECLDVYDFASFEAKLGAIGPAVVKYNSDRIHGVLGMAPDEFYEVAVTRSRVSGREHCETLSRASRERAPYKVHNAQHPTSGTL